MSAAVTVQGLDQLVAGVGQVAQQLRDLADLDRDAAAIVERVASTKAPRRSGALASSGQVVRQGEHWAVQFGSPSVPYAGVIHNGWPAHHIRAQPFVFQAWEQTQDQVMESYAQGVDALLGKVD